MNREPVITAATIVAVFNAVIGALVVFDIWSPSADQVAGLVTLINVIYGVLAGFIVRSNVTPAANLKAAASGGGAQVV